MIKKKILKLFLKRKIPLARKTKDLQLPVVFTIHHTDIQTSSITSSTSIELLKVKNGLSSETIHYFSENPNRELPLKINESRYIALFLVSGSIKKPFSIDCTMEVYDSVNIDFSQSIVNYLFSILFQ